MSARARFGAGALASVAAILAGCAARAPTIAHVHIGHAITGVHVTPDNEGYVVTAERRAAQIVALADRAAAGEEPAIILDAVAAIVVATGSDADFGLRHAVVMASNHLSFAATSADATVNLQRFAPQFARDITRLVERCELIVLLGKDLGPATTAAELSVIVQEIRALANANLAGDDSDGDGTAGSSPGEYGIVQLRREIDAMIAREDPPYRPVDQWYLFNLVRLPGGRWVFDKLGRGGTIEGYQ